MSVSTERVMGLLLEANRVSSEQLESYRDAAEGPMPLGAYIGVMKDFGPDTGDEFDSESNAATYTWVKGEAMILLAVSQLDEESADGMSQVASVNLLRARLEAALTELDTAARVWDEIAFH